jgi:hypothetical protein
MLEGKTALQARALALLTERLGTSVSEVVSILAIVRIPAFTRTRKLLPGGSPERQPSTLSGMLSKALAAAFGLLSLTACDKLKTTGSGVAPSASTVAAAATVCTADETKDELHHFCLKIPAGYKETTDHSQYTKEMGGFSWSAEENNVTRSINMEFRTMSPEQGKVQMDDFARFYTSADVTERREDGAVGGGKGHYWVYGKKPGGTPWLYVTAYLPTDKYLLICSTMVEASKAGGFIKVAADACKTLHST